MVPDPSRCGSREELAAALDAAMPAERLAWLRALRPRQVGALFDLAEGGHVEVGHFHAEPEAIVVHEGINSLPLFRAFQKRVCLHEGAVQGYNHQPLAWLTGPGHFCIRPSEEVEGEVWFDYLWVPPSVPAGFPPPRANTAGLSRFVYGGMIDVVRRVSREVTVGRAWRHGRRTNNTFALLRLPT